MCTTLPNLLKCKKKKFDKIFFFRSLTWLKGGNKEAIDRELVHLQGQIKEASLSKSAKFSDLFKERGTIKGLIIAFGLLGGQQMCGMLAVVIAKKI